jgi:hypothetical protein
LQRELAAWEVKANRILRRDIRAIERKTEQKVSNERTKKMRFAALRNKLKASAQG